ncbi:MAG: hypothetical protein AAB649_02110, partial [Patescibacteria group bacterium]
MDGHTESSVLDQSKKPDHVSSNSEITRPKERRAFAGSEAIRMIEQQVMWGLPKTMLETDIDNSFKMRKETAEQKAASIKLATEAYATSIPIHAITGGDFQGVHDRIQQGELPYFQVISSRVGTERFVLHVDEKGTKRYVRDVDYDAELKAMQYDRLHLAGRLEGHTDEGGNKTNSVIDTINDRYPGLRLDFQHPERERAYLSGRDTATPEPYKLSCYFYAGQGNLKDVVRSLQAEFPQQRVIICEEVDYNNALKPGDETKKYCLDILPI